MLNSISKTSLILTAFAIVTTGLVTLTHILTKDQIAIERENATLKSINQILPKALYDNDITKDCLNLLDQNQKPIRLFRARLNGQPSAIVVESIAPDGYNGRIDLLAAIDTEGKILGVRTVAHNETPGLGDKIEIKRSSWITHFSGLSLTQDNQKNWAVRKDGGTFDQFTGATITPRAVVKSIKNTLVWQQSQTELFSAENQCGELNESN